MPEITSVEIVTFTVEAEDVGKDGFQGLTTIYEPGSTLEMEVPALRISTDTGVRGEYVGGGSTSVAQIKQFAAYLVGRDPLQRERIWSDLRRLVRQNFIGFDELGIGPVDIALWDFAGKYCDLPVHALLGSYRKRLPAYASTMNGDTNGGLDSAEAFADFAETCLELGYPAFKIHGWVQNRDVRTKQDIEREVQTINEVAERVGDEMDLMMDPAGNYETFGDAIAVGKACANNDFYWYEDPYENGGNSNEGHRRLRENLDVAVTPGDFTQGLEANTDSIVSGATDFARADPNTNAGITGVMKIAHAAEGLGLDVELHAAGPAQRQCMAAIRNTNYYEMSLLHPKTSNILNFPIYAGEYEDTLDAIDGRGTIPVPDGPGLGVEYDWDYIEANEQSHTVYD